jgi:L-ascorbate metabolism protein UlaG (beta-lactamase superfamily)
MTQKEMYRLADSVAVEPLVNRWVAWSDTVSPVPFSMHLGNYQLKTLKSYLANPDIHAKACRNPKLFGGPYVDIPVERAGEVQALLEETEKGLGDNVRLAQAVTDFYELLVREAKGQSLDPYYERLPDMLHGYVELIYDYYNHPIVRFIESLLYESPFYKKELQSLSIFRQESDDARSFFLSTPRLPAEGQLDWAVPFESPEVDEFFKLAAEPQPLGRIREILNLRAEDEARLLPLLTNEAAPPAARWEGAGARVRYFGHACVLVEWNGVSILTDPWVGVRSRQEGLERLSYEYLPEKIDFALITHNHHDHFVLETLLRLRHKIECLVVPRSFGMFYADTSLKLMAKRLGFRNVVEVESLDSIKLPDGEIIAVPFLGEHADLGHAKTGYIVRAGKEQILFAADSNCLDKRMYEHVRKVVGPVGTTFLGMECVGAPLSWLYGALMPSRLQHGHDKSRRTKGSDSAAALNLLQTMGSNRVCIYALGNEPWLQYSMGLGLSEESKQIKEANLTLSAARELGFSLAERPFGKYEFSLGANG